jgi:hemolysin activation/secretion protein
MSDTKIYDQLVAEFEEAGKYHGLGFVPPETVALSAYDDTTLIPVVKDSDEPQEDVEEPTEGDVQEETEEVAEEAAPTSILDRIQLLHDSKAENEPEKPEEAEVEHIFPIKRVNFGEVAERVALTTFNFFNKAAA